MKSEAEKWWDAASEYYQEENNIHTKYAHYGPFSPDEDKLELLGHIKNKKILELGCGGGQCTIAFAKKGAISTGIDISSKQLAFAKTLAEKNKVSVKFLKLSAENLGDLKNSSFDIVFSAFALMYIKNLKKCFLEVNRVLKKKGSFVFSIEHPFYILMSPKNNKIEDSYYDTGKVEEMETWPDGSKHKFIFYRRKISDILNALITSGFSLDCAIEPLEFKKKNDRIWEEGYSIKLVKKIAPTIIFKAKKCCD